MNNMKGGEKMRILLILALLVSILIGAMLPAMVLGGNNMIITQTQITTESGNDNSAVTRTQITTESGGNNVDQYTNTTVIPEFGPDIWCKWYNTIIRKVPRVLIRVPAGSRDNWIQISGVYCSG
jgi:hypothetical protein